MYRHRNFRLKVFPELAIILSLVFGSPRLFPPATSMKIRTSTAVMPGKHGLRFPS
jgi:hypothetical protein